MNKILFLLGAHRKSGPLPLEPDPGEPYHVVFNYQVAAADRSTYVLPSTIPGFGQMIRSLEPDTDFDPQPEYPFIHFQSMPGLPGFGVQAAYDMGDGVTELARIPNINNIAHPDRRGKLPKGFQMRFGCAGTGAGFFPNMYIFKYNLNADGSNYVGLRSYTDQDLNTVNLLLDYQIGNQGEYSQIHDLGSSLNGVESTDVKFVIWDTKLQLYVNSPGQLALELDLPAPLVITENVDLALFKPINGKDPDVDVITASDLLIFNAYL